MDVTEAKSSLIKKDQGGSLFYFNNTTLKLTLSWWDECQVKTAVVA